MSLFLLNFILLTFPSPWSYYQTNFLSLIEKDQSYDLSLWNINTVTAMNILHKTQFLFEEE